MEGGNQTDIDGNDWNQRRVTRHKIHRNKCERMIEKMISFDF
jgi:hypothetical protein